MIAIAHPSSTNHLGEREYGAWLDRFSATLSPGMTTLDLGCGEGFDAQTLASLGLRVTGLDLNPDDVRLAASRAPGASFLVADLRDGLPFGDSTIDLVVASLSLHYFDWPTTTWIVAEIARVLRSGGLLLARVNAVGDYGSLYCQGIELEPDFFEVEPGFTKRFFTTSTLQKLLTRRFTIESLEGQKVAVRDRPEKRTLVVSARRREPPRAAGFVSLRRGCW